ncbi:hypothetical protein ACFY4C_21020 [Actinomadura viridis]|uniref:hypothetical protein n=1 Tax=Actinomadura viridis TaxID=58110 RepID=UPI0036AB27D4
MTTSVDADEPQWMYRFVETGAQGGEPEDLYELGKDGWEAVGIAPAGERSVTVLLKKRRR